MVSYGYVPHIRPGDEEARPIARAPSFKSRRRVMEGFHSWLKRNRKILTRYEKKLLSFAGLVALRAALIVCSKTLAAI
jgi:transposase